MASEAATKPSRPSKPLTRSSLRHSLNFTSVGKALADVINKDPRDRNGALKKARESSRRLSLMSSTAATHATVSQKLKSSTPPLGKEDSPSYKTITRRRQSTLLKQGPPSADEHGVKPTEPSPSTPSRRSTLRSKAASSTISSALPKYRPKSAIVEPSKKPLSPVRAGTRRRFSTSEEDDGERESPKGRGTLRSAADKVGRPISPLPHRALAVKVNLPSPTAPSTPTKSKIAQSSAGKPGSSPARAGSVRPAKTVKTAISSSPATRPPSSASSCSSSRTHPSPLNPTSFKNAFGFGRLKASSQNSTPSRGTLRQPPESPLAQHTRQAAVVTLGGKGKDSPARPLQNDERNNEDSMEIGDVELLLAPVASLAAPTPAIPRIRTTVCKITDSELQTPSRPSSLLPTRANLGYLSPLPPSESSPALRPRGRGNDQNRGSIFSWEQVAADSSQILAREDLESRLADVVAPFTPCGPSPNPSSIGLDVPETPNLSALPSPSGYGSISQVLLPDVTPSPAVHHAIFETSIDLPPPADSGTVTLLRLQIAQAEAIAKERLARLQDLEEQLYAAKQCRIRETEELAGQISVLEQQLRNSVETRERVDEERSAFTVTLQDELKQAQVRYDQAAQTGFERGQQAARLSWDAILATVHRSWEVSYVAKEAACLWSSVKDHADEERNNIQSARQVLNVFMAVLDHNQERLQGLLA